MMPLHLNPFASRHLAGMQKRDLGFIRPGAVPPGPVQQAAIQLLNQVSPTESFRSGEWEL